MSTGRTGIEIPSHKTKEITEDKGVSFQMNLVLVMSSSIIRKWNHKPDQESKRKKGRVEIREREEVSDRTLQDEQRPTWRQVLTRLVQNGTSSTVTIHWRCWLDKYLKRQAPSCFLGRAEGSSGSFGWLYSRERLCRVSPKENQCLILQGNVFTSKYNSN